jgi:ribosomal protein S18 acetylase RimI-like enzyme
MHRNQVIHSPDSPVTIGPMTYEEAEDLSAMFRQIVISLPYYNEIAKRSEIAKYSPELLRASVSEFPASVLVAREEGKLVGFCFNKDDDGLVWLAWFGVHPSYRRQGVGLALLQKLEESARHRGSHKIWCDCRTENEASRAALSNYGYVELCTVRNHWYGQDFILWEKSVA